MSARRIDSRATRARLTRAIGGWILLALLTGPAQAQSVDPAAWAKTDLLSRESERLVYDHVVECSMRDEGAKPDERVFARIRATASRDAMSRDQLIALIQRMESVFLFAIGQGFRPTATALTLAAIIDCRPRPGSTAPPQHELILEIGDAGFEATFVDHAKGTRSTHGETWVEAFRP